MAEIIYASYVVSIHQLISSSFPHLDLLYSTFWTAVKPLGGTLDTIHTQTLLTILWLSLSYDNVICFEVSCIKEILFMVFLSLMYNILRFIPFLNSVLIPYLHQVTVCLTSFMSLIYRTKNLHLVH